MNKHGVALSTFIGLLPLVYFIPPWVTQYLVESHFAVTVISVAVIVPIITYVWLPLVMKLWEGLQKNANN